MFCFFYIKPLKCGEEGCVAEGCLIVYTSQKKFWKIYQGCRNFKEREKRFRPITLQFGLCGLADFYWKKEKNKPHFCCGNCKPRYNSNCFISVFKKCIYPKTYSIRMWSISFYSTPKLQADTVPAVMVSLCLDVLSSTQLFLWISNRLARPSLGFHSDCRRRGLSFSPTTLNPSGLHWRLPIDPMVSQRT